MKIGVIGAGHIGKIHIKCIKQIEHFELVGVCDVDESVRKHIAKEFEVPVYSKLDELLDICDVVDIVTPTSTHFSIAKKSLLRGKHVFVEKPISTAAIEALQLHELATQNNCKIQVGHVERFNPAFSAAVRNSKMNPMFIEGHRLAQFNPRGTDVSVILDLMIHDLDLITTLVKSEVVQVYANGVAVVSNTPDICNARIEFENGCVVNLTASRISLKDMRKLRLFQPNSYVSIDMLEKELQIVDMHNEAPKSDHVFELETGNGKKWIEIKMPEIKSTNAILEELKDFHKAIKENTPVIISALDAYKSMQIAQRIAQCVDDSISKIKN